MSFTIARSIDDAVQAMAAGARPIAGGSDLVVGARHGASPLPTQLVAVDRIRELHQLEVDDNGCTIGAAVTHKLLMSNDGITSQYSALADAAALVGSPSTRNVGTLGGNIMNGSPAMDTGAPLIVLGATVELRSSANTRELPVSELWLGPGRTSASSSELCTAVRLPPRPAAAGSAYVRLEYRRAMEIAVVGAAASIELDPTGLVTNASVALTAVAPTIISVDAVVDLLQGKRIDDAALAAVADAASQAATPISDLRASDAYRRHTVGVMAKRAVEAAARRAAGETLTVPINRTLGIGANER